MALSKDARIATKARKHRTIASGAKRGAPDVARNSSAPMLPAGGIGDFFEPAGTISFARIAERFGLSKVQIAETIGVPRDTFHRAARLQSLKTQGRATEMLEIIARITAWAGGEKQAMAWYRAEPLPAFGDRTAEALVKDGKAAAVRDYLDHIALGGFA
jgi:hypothetical protein